MVWISLIIAVFALGFAIFMGIKLRRFKQSLDQKIKNAIQPYQEQITDLNAEIQRLQFLLEQCKKQQNQKNEDWQQQVYQLDIKQLIQEKQKLEQEKLSLKEKTKKLWEQSLAIHKEKERIDRLRREIESKHKEITDSITYASRIQTALLPKDEELQQLFKRYFVLWKPKHIVSGDFYWVHKHKDQVMAVAADCTGHGVPGAFMSLLGISFLNQIVNANPEQEPHQILEQLRQLVIKSLREEKHDGKLSAPQDGMDMALITINTKTNLLKYAGANNPIYIIRNNELIELKPTRAPIGYYLVHRDFKTQTFQLKPQDKIYMFSDGYADQLGGDDGHTKFTRKRFKQLLLKLNQEQIPLPEQKDFLWEAFQIWKGDKAQIDDVLIFGIEA